MDIWTNPGFLYPQRHSAATRSMLQIPGKVVVKDERIEFMAIAAEIEPAAFVGMKFLGTFFEGQVRNPLSANAGHPPPCTARVCRIAQIVTT